ncbi:MAG: 1-acyl-sn-glycerol-3-phosphate acyltransferase [Anaerolineae bacterium]|nr:1-acyl-sn-glycerol-3-phosphate acyltransferase [Anaerolineae bacterium]
MHKQLYQMGRSVMRLYTHLLLDIDVQHNAVMPPTARIIAPNHPTTLDPFLVPAFFDERVHILVTESAFKAPLFGAYLRSVGHVEVVPGEGSRAFEAARQLLTEGQTVVIFPEGALSPLNGGCARGHTGVVRLSLLTGAPILPVGIAVQPERIRYIHTGIKDHQGKEEIARAYIRAPYGVTTGAPLTITGDVEDRARVRQLTDALMQQIMRLSRQSAYRIGTIQSQFGIYETAELPSV